MEDFDALERIESLELEVKKLRRIIEFHELDKISIKYRKAFSDTGLDFFAVPSIKKSPNLQAAPLGMYDNCKKIEVPEDKKELEEAKNRMRSYLERYKEAKQRNAEESQAACERLDDSPQCHP